MIKKLERFFVQALFFIKNLKIFFFTDIKEEVEALF